MPITIFNNLTEKEKENAVKSLIENSSPRQDFFVMIGLSILMATMGLLIGSATVIIGSMLIAPLLYPILSFSLGIVMSNRKLIGRSFVTIFKSLVAGVILAAVSTLLFIEQEFEMTGEIFLRTKPSLAYAFIAIIAGIAASISVIKPQLNSFLPGVAISVALIPPISVIGIGFAELNWLLIRDSLLLFLINSAGIIFASIVFFSLMNFYMKKKVATEAVQKDERQIEKEVEKAKNDN